MPSYLSIIQFKRQSASLLRGSVKIRIHTARLAYVHLGGRPLDWSLLTHLVIQRSFHQVFSSVQVPRCLPPQRTHE